MSTGSLSPRHFQRKANLIPALASEVAAPLLRRWAAARCGRPPAEASRWRRGVLVGTHHIGDLLWLSPSLPALAARWPQCRWFVVADDSSKGVLRGNPHVEVLAPGTRGLTETLASGMFDVAMCYDSGAYWRALVACAEAGIPARASYTHKGFSSLATIPLRFRGRDSYPALIREAAGQFTGLAADWSLRPSVFASDSDEREAASFAARVGAADGVPVVACFPMTRQRTGSWGPDRFADVLNRVHASTGCRPVILGGKCDSGGLERVAELVSCPCNVCAGEIGVTALVAWLRGHAAAALTSDSGPRHMANAAGVEVFFIRNPASGRVEVGPYVSTEHDFGGGGEFLRGRALKRALDGVDAAEVAASIVSAIEASRGHGRGDRVPGHG